MAGCQQGILRCYKRNLTLRSMITSCLLVVHALDVMRRLCIVHGTSHDLEI